jgi:hypothetical protein
MGVAATRRRESKAAMELMGRATEAIGGFRGEREQGAQEADREGEGRRPWNCSSRTST